MLDKEQVIHIANLARLELTEQEIEKMQKDLAGILDYINQLNKIDTSKIDLSKLSLGLENILREDVPIPQNPEIIEKMLVQVPAREANHIKVKEILI
ncbi:MAG: Asp-tRNA(Asn)/Glu-tRNA(Gln) amidotransferase subunit GatC [Candidatus Pacebacteria bacterium]|nr:Asp-tRNA(Asn)/Glu-tRNA(Gln) amidotransferase subunit GatC [Candidatus Paceibacterota bacterium]